MAGPIKIAILANARPAIESMKDVEKSATGMGSKLGGVGKKMAAGFAVAGAAIAAGVGAGLKVAIDEAASLSAAIGTTKSIFGKSAQGMLDWSKTASTTLGLSQSEALNATKVFGGFFTGVGMGAKEAADMSKNWTTMAANMAAFGDIPVADSLDAVKSALIGEYDPIQKLIPTISAASLQQKAMELSGKKNAKALTDQDKAAALNAIMMDSMANKVGAAERKQKGYAVQMDILKAQLKNAAAAVGGVFLPALTKSMGFVNDKALPAVKKLGEFLGPKLKTAFKGLSGFKPPKAVIDVASSKEMTSIFTNLKKGFVSLGPLFSKVAAVIMPIVTQVGKTLGAAFTKALPQIKAIVGTIGEIVGLTFELIRARVALVVTAIQFLWQNFGANILGYLSSTFAAVVTVLQGAFNIVKGIFNILIGLLTGDWQRAWDGVKGIVQGAWQIIVGVFNAIKASAKLLISTVGKVLSLGWTAIKSVTMSVWNAIKTFLVVTIWGGIKSGIVSAASAIGSAIASAWNAVKSATTTAWNAVKSATLAVWNGIRAFFSAWWAGVKALVSSAGASIRSAIAAAWAAVRSATASAWNAIKNAVSSGISNVVSTVKGLPGKVKSAIGNVAGLLYNVGKDMIQGMINGVGLMGGLLAAKVKSIVKNAVDGLLSYLQPGSPSKLFEKIGVMSAQGYMQGWEISGDNLKDTVEKLIADVVKAFPNTIKKTFPKGTKLSVIEKWKKQEIAAGKKRVAKKNALITSIERDNLLLTHLIDQRDAVAEDFKAANEHLADLQQQRADAVTSVAGTFEATFKLINDSAEEGIASIDGILQRSRDAVAQSQQFADQLKTLATKGVSPKILQELAMAGPQAGLDTARALVDASADQIKELNDNYAQIASTGQAAGETVAGHMYDAGVAAARAVADGFASQQAALEARILGIVDKLTAAINAAVAAVTPKPVPVPAVVVTQPKQPVAKKPPKGKAAPKKAVPAVTTKATPVSVTVNTGAVVDKRGMVDAISAAFNEVSGQLGRPISMNVR